MPAEPKNVIIFGLTELASLLWYEFTNDSSYQVVAFTVDKDYVAQSCLHGLPVIPFENIQEAFPGNQTNMHLPIGWKGMNVLRKTKFIQAKNMGFHIISYVSSRSVIWPDLCLGLNCSIHQSVSVGPFTHIGDNNMIFNGATIGHHVTIEDDCYIGGRAMVCGGATIGKNSVLGANSTVLEGITIAPRCFVGAGAVVVRDTEENGVYLGVPARLSNIKADCLPRVL